MKRYSDLKALAFMSKWAGPKSGEVEAPVHVRIKPVNYCNHRCWFCAYRAESLDLGSEMNLKDKLSHEKFIEIANDIVDMGVKAVTFSGGGEPLLHASLSEVIEILSKAKVKIGMLTNGARLKGDLAQKVKRHATWVRVSIDAFEPARYSRNRAIDIGAWSELLENVKKFQSLEGSCELGFSFIVDNENHDDLAPLSEFAHQYRHTHVKVSPCVVSDDLHKNREYHLGNKSKVTEALTEIKKKYPALIVDHYHDPSHSYQKKYHQCHFGKLLTVIGADANVYVCQDKAYTEGGLLGSLKSASFKEVWFSEKTQSRLREIDPTVQCAHHCVAHQKNQMMDEFLSIDPMHGVFV